MTQKVMIAVTINYSDKFQLQHVLKIWLVSCC